MTAIKAGVTNVVNVNKDDIQYAVPRGDSGARIHQSRRRRFKFILKLCTIRNKDEESFKMSK